MEKIKGMMILIMVALIIAGGMLHATNKSYKEAEIIHIHPDIMRYWNGDAFIEFEFSSNYEKYKNPIEISIIPFSNGKKLSEIKFKNVSLKKIQTFPEEITIPVDGVEINISVIISILELRIFNFPECESAKIILHYSNGNATGWGKVFQIQK